MAGCCGVTAAPGAQERPGKRAAAVGPRGCSEVAVPAVRVVLVSEAVPGVRAVRVGPAGG
ncbi:hypothetical protein MPRG_53200 [Mycobacterium paragordonae]|uniref:Uncharacterized protein n=1 Tax=Mycobacterium paragordonae TaxID=1389713 RepID=A0ABQ1CCR8_9MYCO|nr:hypothetical protein MPRG_53200 [Mycobacterium paragordonae]